uniref:Uncharacterized protein n=1 Tax=Tanacetum cinerariifolium TaxID=118510 RepID=A0A6L2KUN5_TANCI|nr:hypothetical protein [Tanacetum cinerariifolium]
MHLNKGIIAYINADKDVTLEEIKVEKNADVQRRLEESQAKVYHIDLKHADKVLSMQDDEPEPAELQKVIQVVTTAKLMTEVVTAATTAITDVAPITAVTIIAAPNAARRRKGVVIRDPKETAAPLIIIHTEPKSKDKVKGIMVQEPKPLKKKAQIKQDKAYVRELEAELNKNINWDDVIEQVQRKEKEDNAVLRYQAMKRKPQTEAQARKNMIVYLKIWLDSRWTTLRKSKEQLEEEGSRALKRQSESLEEKVAKKKKKLDEEVEELKKHLQIMPNDDDDVYTEATPLALKDFAAALAVLITRASQSRQHGKNELVFHPYSRSNVIKSSQNIIERAITELVEFISAHLYFSLVLVHKRLSEIERIRLVFGVMPVKMFSGSLGTFFKIIL